MTYSNPILACGIVFYKIVDNKLQLLLSKYNHKQQLEDFGGKIEITDTSVFDAMAREVMEESNHLITAEYLKERLHHDDNITFYYNKHSKYYVWLIQVDNTFFPDTSVFGTEEQLNPIKKRTVQWYNFHEVHKKLSDRLSNSIFMDYMYHLSDSHTL